MARRQHTRKVPVSLPERDNAQAGWMRGFRVSGFTLTVLFLIVAALVSLAPSLKNLVEQQQEIALREQQLADARNQVDELEQQVARWQDPAYLKAQARDRLIYAFPGDITYLVADDRENVAATPVLPISDELQTSKVDWARSMLDSVLTAGLTEQPADQIVSPQLQDQQ